MSMELATQEIQTLESQFNDIVSLASDVNGEIQTQDQYDTCQLVIERSKEISSRWGGLFEPIRAAQRNALDITYATINKVKTPCENFVKNLTPKCFAWERKKQAEARLLEQKLQADARKQAEDFAIQEAEHFVKEGKTEIADAILAAPIPVAPVVRVDSQVKTAENLSRRITWKARVIDLPTLVKAVHEGKVEKTLVIENQSVLDALAKALKGELRIPGVEAYEDVSYATKRTFGTK